MWADTCIDSSLTLNYIFPLGNSQPSFLVAPLCPHLPSFTVFPPSFQPCKSLLFSSLLPLSSLQASSLPHCYISPYIPIYPRLSRCTYLVSGMISCISYQAHTRLKIGCWYQFPLQYCIDQYMTEAALDVWFLQWKKNVSYSVPHIFKCIYRLVQYSLSNSSQIQCVISVSKWVVLPYT